jgi:hypothetical protein
VLLSGCFPNPVHVPDLDLTGQQAELDRMLQQSKLGQAMMKQPDTPDWYDQREKTTQALGDRVFDKECNRVFDSLTVALASLGAHVENMERQSGYISARGTLLPPDRAKQLRRDGLVEWCRINGYDPDLLEVRGKYSVDPDVGGGMMEQMGITMTISLVKQSNKQTKVKLRFTGVYYPPYLSELYQVVWPALDKQIFMDKGTD